MVEDGGELERQYNRLPRRLREAIPDDALLIKHYMARASAASHAPPHLHLGCLLPALAFTLASHGYTWGDKSEPFALMSALVTPPAAGKTTAISFVRKTTRPAFKKILDRNPWIRADGTFEGLWMPSKKGYRASDDTTPILWWNDECTKMWTQDNFKSNMLQMVDGETLERHVQHLQFKARKNDLDADFLTLTQPRLSCILATTWDDLGEVPEANMRGGLHSRTMYWTSRTLIPIIPWPEKIMLDELQLTFHNFCNQLDVNAVLPTDRFLDDDPLPDEKRGKNIRFTQEGRDLLTKTLSGITAKIKADLKFRNVREISTRYFERAKQIACVFAATRNNRVVEIQDVAAACKLHALLVEGALSVTSITEDTGKIARMKNRVLTDLRSAGKDGISRSHVYNLNRSWKKNEIDEALGVMETTGLITCQQVKNPKSGRLRWMMWLTDLAPEVKPPELPPPLPN